MRNVDKSAAHAICGAKTRSGLLVAKTEHGRAGESVELLRQGCCY